MYPKHYRSNRAQLAMGLTLKEKMTFGLVGIVLIGGAVIIARNVIRKRLADAEENKSYLDGSAATYAKQLRMAFNNDGWFGTNINAIRETIVRLPSKQVMRQVIDSYEKLYSRSLLRDMENELQSSEYNEMLAIISAKPEKYNADTPTQQLPLVQYQSWASRLKAAFDKSYGPFPGTDEDAINAVFNEIPTQSAFVQTGTIYNSMYGRDLITDLKGELEFWEYPTYMQVITQKPK
ncbi:annexin [Chitinophaga agri]|uniref:Annexin n=1 Tax=Chitinophaga agri TaxID=2703787 RepID=A0A6B9ZEH5_9BACT|nr:annexin [Chitinophaga agri]QHS60832.1 annexin [Chitinophaga agri]